MMLFTCRGFPPIPAHSEQPLYMDTHCPGMVHGNHSNESEWVHELAEWVQQFIGAKSILFMNDVEK